jgi:hypothetical protein
MEHAIAHFGLPYAAFYSTSIQTCSTLPRDAHFKVYRHGYRRIDIKTSSLIVVRRTRAAAVSDEHPVVLYVLSEPEPPFNPG